MAEIVTFKCAGKVMHYRPGNIYTEELTPLLKMLLLRDHQLNLIDPPTLEERPVQVAREDREDPSPPEPNRQTHRRSNRSGAKEKSEQRSQGDSGPSSSL